MQNWVEIELQLPESLKTWATDTFDKNDIESIPDPHVTVLYGFDPKYYNEIQKQLDEFKLEPKDFTFVGKPRQGDHTKNAWLIGVHSPRLQELFWTLYNKYDNEHTLINGKYDPHITLCYTKTTTKKIQSNN